MAYLENHPNYWYCELCFTFYLYGTEHDCEKELKEDKG